jgi:hypothetical protein
MSAGTISTHGEMGGRWFLQSTRQNSGWWRQSGAALLLKSPLGPAVFRPEATRSSSQTTVLRRGKNLCLRCVLLSDACVRASGATGRCTRLNTMGCPHSIANRPFIRGSTGYRKRSVEELTLAAVRATRWRHLLVWPECPAVKN